MSMVRFNGLPFVLLIFCLMMSLAEHCAAGEMTDVPPSWKVLPIPRYADYDSPGSFLIMGKTAIVRKAGGPYETARDSQKELLGSSTITEEELAAILKTNGVTDLACLADDLPSYENYDTLILLGAPARNKQTKKYFAEMKLSFSSWDDPNTPGDEFTKWSDFGKEGYLLKAGRCGKQNIVILAGYDYDDAGKKFHGAGTFYAMQSLRQLIVKGADGVKIKTAEIADKPLIAMRACYINFRPEFDQNERNVNLLPQIKANGNIIWYGDQIVGYNMEAASRFRYPWKPEQLEFFAKTGRRCRERFVDMIFCMNPDHATSLWAAPKAFDGKTTDPLHYDPDHKVEPQFKEMWAKLGYAVENDVDILAAKFTQINNAMHGGVIFQMMNEDDVFGLVHPEDKKLFNTQTTDPRQNAMNYGRARAQLLIRLYKKIREVCPDSRDIMCLCPPDGLAYQTPLEKNEFNSRDFFITFAETIKAAGLQQKMPIMTSGGNTVAETLTANTIKNFKEWTQGSPIILFENNFADYFHVGAYEYDPKGPRSLLQTNKEYPAGYRDKELYQYLDAVHWNMNALCDLTVHAWTYCQFMWNMPAGNKNELDALATRKVCSAECYPLVKSFYEEFDNPMCYLMDQQPPGRLKVISDRIVFASGTGEDISSWVYNITFTDAMRLECQRLRGLLGKMIPELEQKWDMPFVKQASLRSFGYSPYNFCSVYLAYGYLQGWEGETPEKILAGGDLRDLYLEADTIQQNFFQGPEMVPGMADRDHSSYQGRLLYLYTKGYKKDAPPTPAEADFYIDIWSKGLLNKFFAPASSIILPDLADNDPRLAGDWGKTQDADGKKFRTIASQASLKMEPFKGPHLIRIQLGTSATALTESVKVQLSLGGISREEAVCKPRWINWYLPEGAGLASLTIKTQTPIRVYALEIYKEKPWKSNNNK